MRTSVVVCAYADERFDRLSGAVASLGAQTAPPAEVIVVIDHNPKLLDRARRAYPGALVVPNLGTRGLSDARNSGVNRAYGDVVAFLDDDAEAAPDWLERLTAPYADSSVAGVGGWIEAVWADGVQRAHDRDRKSTRLNSSHR